MSRVREPYPKRAVGRDESPTRPFCVVGRAALLRGHYDQAIQFIARTVPEQALTNVLMLMQNKPRPWHQSAGHN